MSTGIALQLAVDTLAAAALYALTALAVSLAYAGSGVVHLAIGQVAAGGALSATAVLAAGGPLAAAVAAGLGVGGLLSAAAERGLVAPSRRSALLGSVLLLGAGVVVEEVLRGLFPQPAYAFPSTPGTFRVLGGIVHAFDLVTLAAVGLVAAAAVALLRAPRLGAALRVTARAPDFAERLGVDTALVRTLSFAAGGVLATAVVLLGAARFPVSAGGGLTLALRGIAAAAGGSMTSPPLAVASAVAIATAEVVGGYFLGGGGELLADAVAAAIVFTWWRR